MLPLQAVRAVTEFMSLTAFLRRGRTHGGCFCFCFCLVQSIIFSIDRIMDCTKKTIYDYWMEKDIPFLTLCGFLIMVCWGGLCRVVT